MSEIATETPNYRALREASVPPISIRQLAKRMKITDVYLSELERGRKPWPKRRSDQFLSTLAGWKVEQSPPPTLEPPPAPAETPAPVEPPVHAEAAPQA